MTGMERRRFPIITSPIYVGHRCIDQLIICHVVKARNVDSIEPTPPGRIADSERTNTAVLAKMMFVGPRVELVFRER